MSADSRYPHLYDYCVSSWERLGVLGKHCLINPLQLPERKLGDGKYYQANVERETGAQRNPTMC